MRNFFTRRNGKKEIINELYDLQIQYDTLKNKVNFLKAYKENLEAIISVYNHGMELIGLEEKDDSYYAIAMKAIPQKAPVFTADALEIYLYHLPYVNCRTPLCNGEYEMCIHSPLYSMGNLMVDTEIRSEESV